MIVILLTTKTMNGKFFDDSLKINYSLNYLKNKNVKICSKNLKNIYLPRAAKYSWYLHKFLLT